MEQRRDELGSDPDSQLALLKKNRPKVLILNFFWMFLIVMPVVVPFMESYGLGMAEIYQLQAIFAISVVLLEVPSGYLADLFGRRVSLILAGVFHGSAFTVLAQSEDFWGFVVFELLAALGNSFFSGSDVALIYDTQEALGEDAEDSSMLGRKLMWSQVGETVAAPLGGLLVLGGVTWPAQVNAWVAWIPLLVAITLVEPPRRKLEHRHRENFGRLLKLIFRSEAILRWTFLSLVCYGLTTLMAVWAFQGYWKSMQVPLVWFGILWAIYNLTVGMTGRFATGMEKRWGPRAVLLFIAALPITGYGGMALFYQGPDTSLAFMIGGIIIGLSFSVSRGLTQVVTKGALNSRVPAELRATANSLSSLGVRIGFAVLGPLLGWSFDEKGYFSSLLVAAGVCVSFALLVQLPLVAHLKSANK
ncbi:MAG: hypothetical protein CBC13_11835 [Planctomycetia bacterium TMED53]|nr:MAG: hypothetical protein CBC13_11835 [Planctomycetia bacterium TMED53]